MSKYCEECGADISCSNCSGSGEVLEDEDYTERIEECCGESRYGSYCPDCGRDLEISKTRRVKNDCPECNGYGSTSCNHEYFYCWKCEERKIFRCYYIKNYMIIPTIVSPRYYSSYSCTSCGSSPRDEDQ